ncbi:hypothetical protein H7X46_10535 [Pseudonocardia sp. C8]|uniref:hypothetical protein n=1 Tax=Pseudonocardia sp. C8 TaxID=2762759 RepID=UPI0016427C49|nr:hypothetical protein [Pseudonocardia sp. C8]MBC3191498.1 hypothetical protein [Pseudonocardia sp. C8]
MSTRDPSSPAGDAPGAGDGSPALPAAGLRLAAALTARPAVLLRRGGAWAAALGRVGLGCSAGEPREDAGPPGGGWLLPGPVRRRATQALRVTTDALSGLLDDAQAGPDFPLPARDAARLRALLGGTPGSAGAPPGPAAPLRPGGPATPPGPAAPAPPGGPPRSVARTGEPAGPGTPSPGDGPVRGRDVAATPGAVVLRTPVFELLQYLPVTERVHDAPVLVVPPPAHPYWLADLAPGYSLVEHLVARGLQVFALSWRPAGPADTGRDLDAHAAAVLDALEAGTRIARTPRASLLGVRSGGLLAAAVQAHQAAVGLDDRVAAVGYLATGLDPAGAARPDPPDGVGERAAAALRAWAADLRPLPPALEAGLAALAADDGAGIRVLGTPVHPAELRRDGYLVAAAGDPAPPWTGDRAPGGSCRLVLAPGDRAGALIAPPRAATSFRVASCEAGAGLPEAWPEGAEHVEGSWWDDLAGWLADRSGSLRDAPPELGGRRLRPLFPAPGTYLAAERGVPATTM